MKEKKAFQLYTVEEKLKIVQDHLNNHISIRACDSRITNIKYTKIANHD